ncbi:nitrile hydratase subunit beta [Mycobacterium sp. NPDC050551]|uniref:nitrile hydratase subunit beta n=1 Tax=Mycobacterium sp. NPDC050551 TaxID=3155407 RepID=UPI003444929F
MDGVHDMGGMDGFGAVRPEPPGPVFTHEWQGRVFAMSMAMGARGVWNIDVGRFGIETLPPRVYHDSSYYERWFLRLVDVAMAYGLVDPDEVDGRRAAAATDATTFTVDDVARVLKRGNYVRPATRDPRFAPGDRVRARNIHPRSHTRLPRYVRGHVGVVERIHQPNVFPDSVVRGDGEDPQWLYTVRFEGRDLWGDDAEPGTAVSVDAFEPYLEEV